MTWAARFGEGGAETPGKSGRREKKNGLSKHDENSGKKDDLLVVPDSAPEFGTLRGIGGLGIRLEIPTNNGRKRGWR